MLHLTANRDGAMVTGEHLSPLEINVQVRVAPVPATFPEVPAPETASLARLEPSRVGRSGLATLVPFLAGQLTPVQASGPAGTSSQGQRGQGVSVPAQGPR